MAGEDYDQRTALHLGKLLHPVTSGYLQVYFRLNKNCLASSEGHLEVVRFLVETACVKISVKDRWGATPIDNAKQFKQQEIIDYLNKLNLNDSPRIPGATNISDI